jgi:hypothetical protein
VSRSKNPFDQLRRYKDERAGCLTPVGQNARVSSKTECRKVQGTGCHVRVELPSGHGAEAGLIGAGDQSHIILI